MKSSGQVLADPLRNLERVKDDFPGSRRMIAYTGKERRWMGTGIEAMPWPQVISELLA